MTGKAMPCKEERKKKNGGGEAMLRILSFYILISTFYI